MCGIVGIYNLGKTKPIPISGITQMISAIKHRGPDEQGLYIDDYIALGHTRLSIIDLSSGIQPISNEDETIWIIFNGEIFNYPELKNDLLKKGHRFNTNTDTEVIIHLYEEKGLKCLEYLNGQFAFAIWDLNNRELFIARDRVGILPLFYTINKEQFVFASEMKSILAFTKDYQGIDFDGLEQTFTFWSTLAPTTIIKNIYELKPGHFIRVSPQKIQQQKYWEVPFISSDEQQVKSFDESIEAVNELLLDSIKIRLRADVKVGSYMSGGLDSSGLTASIKKFFNNDLRTFGIRFEEEKYDEGNYQDEMVSYLGVNHSEVFASNKLIGEELKKVVWQVEKPLLRFSPIPLFLLSKIVRENDYKVVITGEGADEIFGGYNIFKETKVRNFWARRPESEYRPLLLRKLYPYILNDPKLFNTLKAFFGVGIETPEHPLFSHLIRWNNSSRIKNFFSDETKKEIGNYDALSNVTNELPQDFQKFDYLSKAQFLEIKTFLSSYLLSSQGDRVAMANSVEIRVPYLDHRIIEFMGRIPARWKIQGMNEKYLLKKVFANILPRSIIYRAKHPYRAPIKQSLFNENLLFVKETLSEKEIKKLGIFNSLKVTKLIDKLEKNTDASEVDSMALCGILTTQILAKQLEDYTISEINSNISYGLFVDKRKNKTRILYN